MILPIKKRKRTYQKISSQIRVSTKQKNEIWGIIFATFSILASLALAGNLGIFGDIFANSLQYLFGVGVFLVPVIFGILSILLFFSQKISMNFTRLIGVFLIFSGGLGIFQIFSLPPGEIFNQKNYLAGGFFGAASSILPRYFLGNAGAVAFLMSLFLIGIIITFPISITEIFVNFFSIFEKIFSKKEKKYIKNKKSNKLEIVSGKNSELPKKKQNEIDYKKEKIIHNEKPLVKKTDKWELPSIEILSPEKSEIFANEKELQKKAENIQKKLSEFGIGCSLGPVHVGPTVTQFTLSPEEGVKVAKIKNLKNDLALSLAAKSIRIEAPIPGKNLIGIEIPNEKRSTVRLREILESKEFSKIKSPLRIVIGRDVAGNPVVEDLAEMPHLLMAGATGAGKSVGMNTFLLSLLFQNSPNDLKFILIDPKRVELAAYNAIPHLLAPVITDAEKALSALRWAVAEMMRRYGELAKKKYRNIYEFNAKEEEKMPKIIIVIDELADLMMRQFKKDTEAAICRIAQMARAVGMHLIIATQRPSVDVITGLIKANVPTRISFAVTSIIDSRTILDSVGAEDLLGKGDLLFSNSSLGKPKRVQGVFVSSEEIEKVTNRIKLTEEPEYNSSILEEKTNDVSGVGLPGDAGGDSDDLLESAVEVIRNTGKASASLLQRRLSIGYARAARILDILEQRGIIGPARGAKPREIYL